MQLTRQMLGGAQSSWWCKHCFIVQHDAPQMLMQLQKCTAHGEAGRTVEEEMGVACDKALWS